MAECQSQECPIYSFSILFTVAGGTKKREMVEGNVQRRGAGFQSTPLEGRKSQLAVWPTNSNEENG